MRFDPKMSGHSFTKDEFKYCAGGVCNGFTAVLGPSALGLAYLGSRSIGTDGLSAIWFGCSAFCTATALKAATLHIERRYNDYHHRYIMRPGKLIPAFLAFIAASIILTV